MSDTSDTSDTPRSQFPLIIRWPEDLLSAIPYIIGYHPSDDLVIVGLTGRDYTASLRSDLWPPGAPCPVTPDMLRATGIDAALIAAYGPPGDTAEALAHLLPVLATTGITPHHILSVTGRTYTDHTHLGTSPLPVPAADTAIAAGLVAAGYGALPDKTTFATHLDTVPGPFTLAVTNALNHHHTSPAADLQNWARELLTTDDHLPSPEATAALLLALTDHTFALETAATPVAPGELTARIPLFTHLVRHTHSPHRAIPAALLADHAARAGNGGLARLALTHATTAAPTNTLVHAITDHIGHPHQPPKRAQP